MGGRGASSGRNRANNGSNALSRLLTGTNYFLYAKGPGEKNYTLFSPSTGERGMLKTYAPLFKADKADESVEWMSKNNPGFKFKKKKAK